MAAEGLAPYGANLFQGNFAKGQEGAILGPGDRVVLRLWGGGLNVDGTFTVDAQGRIDLPEVGSLPVQGATVLVARGPFGAEAERALLATHGIEWLVTKNAGGEATRGKLEAARALGLRVIMVQRPQVPARASTDQVDAVMHWLAHATVPGATASLP